jgi:hypothetical protein
MCVRVFAALLLTPCVFGLNYQLSTSGAECAVGNDKKQGDQIGSGYMSLDECKAAACDSNGNNCAQWIEFGTFGEGNSRILFDPVQYID